MYFCLSKIVIVLLTLFYILFLLKNSFTHLMCYSVLFPISLSIPLQHSSSITGSTIIYFPNFLYLVLQVSTPPAILEPVPLGEVAGQQPALAPGLYMNPHIWQLLSAAPPADCPSESSGPASSRAVWLLWAARERPGCLQQAALSAP